MTTLGSQRRALAAESMVFAGRLLTHWRRAPLVPLQSLLFPTILLIVYYMLVSKSMMRLTGGDGLDVVVSMCAVAGGMSGALAAALSIPDERDDGLLSRFWMMPVHRASALAGTLLAEAARTLAATVVIVAVGILLGLRFHGGPGAAVLFVLIPVLWVSVYATMVIVVALRCQSRVVLTWINTFSLGAVFGSSAVIPPDLLPGWATWFVSKQPMSPTIESMKALARDGFALGPLLWTAAWIIAIGVPMGALAMGSYRAAATSGT
ncbi:ABC transporter permease [Mycolicibacterium sp. 050158]|uniref:ABC transporter permease n=1 Tax=Mycolicibacterium sp. 050158 TaxID=3090602 RepID=UPI00299DC539|nr:ABC transporter permease [Mycolicibacterium sp. 050158]MDX1891018.1 ABC transporter permease [Mycolicibacterium sp. 050158]